MSATGYIQIHAYTSNAQLPLKNTAVAITNPDGSTIAMRLTDSSGMLREPLPITVPDLSAGTSPGTGQVPFRSVNLYARKENYKEIEVQNLQVFPNTITQQNLEFIPLPELPEVWTQGETFDTISQNL